MTDIRCQECGLSIDLCQPDPTAEQLAQDWGFPQMVLGRIEITRHELPAVGFLMIFQHGLVFYPDLQKEDQHYIDVWYNQVHSTSLIRKLWMSAQRDTTDYSSDLNLYTLKASDVWIIPGSFFVPWINLEMLYFHHRHWVLARPGLKPLYFKSHTEYHLFAKRVEAIKVHQPKLEPEDQ